MNRHSALLIAIAGAALVTLTACGGSASSSSSAPASSAAATSSAGETAASSAPNVDACMVLTNEEIAGIIGADPGPGVSDPANPTGCAYDAIPMTVLYAAGADYDKIVAQSAAQFTADERTDVSDLGDAAVKFTTPDGASVLIVHSGDVTFGVTGQDANVAPLIELMMSKQ